jgi:hypothetical protein
MQFTAAANAIRLNLLGIDAFKTLLTPPTRFFYSLSTKQAPKYLVVVVAKMTSIVIFARKWVLTPPTPVVIARKQRVINIV